MVSGISTCFCFFYNRDLKFLIINEGTMYVESIDVQSNCIPVKKPVAPGRGKLILSRVVDGG